MSEFIVVRDGAMWLVVEVPEDGTAVVVGRWIDRAKAEQECCSWADLADSERAA